MLNKRYFFPKSMVIMAMLSAVIMACGGNKTSATANGEQPLAGPDFNADSAWAFCLRQCQFGPRVMNSAAHDSCAQWIVSRFQQYGMTVSQQHATLKGYDGTSLNATNIIASFKPKAANRLLICAHYDCRPWADNDADSANWQKPVMGANDGASGVAVMIELARLLSLNDSLDRGVDFVCFDAEDWGVPQWSDHQGDGSDTWALGAQHWALKTKESGYKADYGILLDMVGGQGATFYREGYSQTYAPAIVEKVWQSAHVLGYGSFFPFADGGMITDDHVPVNNIAGIPTIDIVPYYPDCPQSSFGPRWHTIADTMDGIDANTLKAVGQTIIQVLYSE